MKTLTGLLLLAFMASGIYADNQVVVRKYKHKPIANDHLGIISLSVKARIHLNFLENYDLDEQQTMVYKELFQWLPQAFEGASSCNITEICTTAVLNSMSPYRVLLDHNDTITLHLPKRVHFSGDKDTWPKHYLVIEITEVSDDSSFRKINVLWEGRHTPMLGSSARPGARSEPVPARPKGEFVVTNGAVDIMVEKKEKPEECLHYACKYAFVDCGKNELVCYGTVSAEGCSSSADRDAPNGVWSISIKELVRQIVEDSPFELKK